MALRMYKPGQGTYSRGIAAVAIGGFSVFGLLRLHEWLSSRDWWAGAFAEGTFWDVLSEIFPPTPATVLVVLLAAGLAYLLWYFNNKPKVVDFLVDTESEVKKVSWASRKEVVGSTLVVITTVVIMGTYLAFIDFVLTWIQKNFFT